MKLKVTPIGNKEDDRLSKLLDRLFDAHLIGSTLVEGSTFTEAEAKKVLAGESIHGHIIEEHLELTNGKDAASYLHRLFFEKKIITEESIDLCHELLFKDFDSNKCAGKNRGATGESAFTLILENGSTFKHEYEHPKIVKRDYLPYLNYHINRALPKDHDSTCLRLAELYFHFQMLHPYSDGNGRIGRFLISGKIASEKGLFFRFNKRDGIDHLQLMMSLTIQFKKDRRVVNLEPLALFFKEHLEDF